METRKHAPLAALAVALMLALSPLGALAEKGGKVEGVFMPWAW